MLLPILITYGTDLPVPVSGEHDYFNFKCAYVKSLVLHYFSKVLMVFCVRCQMTSVSSTSASVTRPSANAWRYPGISFAEN